MRLKGKASVRKFYYSVVLSAAILYSFSGHAQTIEETYQRALKEGGALNVYGTLTPDTAAKVLPVFEKRFPGIKASTPAQVPIRSLPARFRKRAVAEPLATFFT